MKPSWIMENESESTACGICGICTVNLLNLTPQEHLLVAKIFKCISLNSQSNRVCDPCIHKLYNFKNFLKGIILNQIKLRNTHERKMQEDPNKDPEEDEPHIDKYNCRCSECQKKFGSLPLLVDVIEQNENKTKQNENKTEKKSDEPVPSTSREMSPGSSRKLMKCTRCEKTFSHKGDYNKHARTHTGEKPFNCTVCDRKFAHTSNLARHMRLHSGDKPFTCDNCKKTFSRKDKLEVHKKSKTCKKTS